MVRWDVDSFSFCSRGGQPPYPYVHQRVNEHAFARTTDLEAYRKLRHPGSNRFLLVTARSLVPQRVEGLNPEPMTI